MINRITTRTITFQHAFAMMGLEGWQPAGSYIIEAEEELLQARSFPAWRRLHRAIHLPRQPGASMIEQVAPVDPAAIEAALAADALAG